MARASTFFERAEARRPHIPHSVVDLDHEDHYSDTSRIKGLSDGVFAIAMTLLAFTLLEALPGTALGLREFLDEFVVPLLVYGMSFIILGTYWTGHAIQFHYIVRSDRPLMVRTVLFMVFVSLVPFSTAYLGRFHTDHVAIGLYSVNLMLCGVALHGSLLYATKDPTMLHRAFDRRIFRGVRVSFLLGPVLYALAFALAFLDPLAAFVLCVAVPVLTFFPNPFWGRAFMHILRSAEP